MTIGIVRGLITLALFVAFIAIWIWAWSRHRQADFDAAARLPLGSDPDFPHSEKRGQTPFSDEPE